MDFDDAFAAKRQQSVRNKFFDDFITGAEPPKKRLATQEMETTAAGDVDKMLLDFSLDGDATAANQPAMKTVGSMMSPTSMDASLVPEEHFFRTLASKT